MWLKQHNKVSTYILLYYALSLLYALMIHYSLSAYYIVTIVTSRSIIQVNKSEPNPMILCSNPMWSMYMTSGTVHTYVMLVMLNYCTYVQYIVTVFN